MNLVVGIGGTGQLILHYYLQMYLLGLVDPFKAVLIDTDDFLPSLQAIRSFLQNVQYGMGREAATKLTQMVLARVKPEGESDVVRHLTGQAFQQLSADHAVRAFFSSDTLRQRTDQGLYFRPALVDVVAYDDVITAQEAQLIPDRESNVVVVGSVIGGTAGGVMAPILAKLQELARGQASVSLRCVLFGEYFRPDEKLMGGGEKRYRSNKTLVCKMLSERNFDLHSFVFIEQPRMSKRDTAEEKKSEGLLWPNLEEPYWTGITSVEHLLRDSTRDVRSEFQDREVPTDVARRSLIREAARDRLRQRIGILTAILDERVISRLGFEAIPVWPWADPFVELIANYWRISRRQVKGGNTSLRNFPTQLQDEIERVWNEAVNTDQYGLAKVFPKMVSPLATVNEVRNAGWPKGPEIVERTGFGSPEEARQTVASTIVFHALRGRI